MVICAVLPFSLRLNNVFLRLGARFCASAPFFQKNPIFAPRLPPGAIGAPRCARAPRRALFALLTT
ncbi:hypothetical protein HanIR_Chr03g0101141 [Helianthus annuus]|nr:hypothetical protein HanIR_Chr03g0101141 [Helianthus annuus]